MVRAAALAAAWLSALTATSALPSCDVDTSCTYTTPYKGGSFTFDLRGLCNRNQDYRFPDWNAPNKEDALGHVYYAQICGTANQNCLPKDWQSEYEYGRAVQQWGSAPDCDFSCYEEGTGVAVCCTAPCSVVAVSTPQFRLLQPGVPESGFELFYQGETPTGSDPYSCDYNPTTFQPYPRVTHMQFLCDPKADGYAVFSNAYQNASDDCEYFLQFRTKAACLPDQVPISGGWVFNIIVLVTTAVYVLAAFGLAWHWEKRIGFPSSHMAFWSGLNELMFEGALFVASGFRKPTGRLAKALPGAASGGLLGVSGSVATESIALKASGDGATASSSESLGGGYQGGDAGASSSGARAGYTDL